MKISMLGKSVALLALVSLVSCGGGGGSGGGGSASTSGIGGTGVTSGTITGFGSVHVNGVKFDTDPSSTSIEIDEDGAKHAETELEVGMLVDVEAEFHNDGTQKANRIRFENIVVGPVDAIPTATPGTLTVFGQTVNSNGKTVIRDGTDAIVDFSAIKLGDNVKVSGLADLTTGAITARRIQIVPAGTPIELKVKGTATQVASGTKLFNINGLVIDWGSAKTVDPAAGPKEGDFVVAKGGTQASAGGTYSPDSLRVKALTEVKVGQRAEIEGVIADFKSAGDFTVNGKKVDASTATINPASTVLADGLHVEVQGTVNDSGVLVAKSVKIEEEQEHHINVRLEANLEDVQGAKGTPANTVKLLGKSISVTAMTQFEDEDSHTRPFNFDNFDSVLKTGDHVIVRAFTDSAGVLTAARIERRKASDEEIVQGPLDSPPTATTMSILGIKVLIGPNTESKRDSIETFSTGSLVKVRGRAGSGADDTIDATGGQVESERDD